MPQFESHEATPTTGMAASGSFPSTHWSVVLAAGGCSTAAGDVALENLCRAYWPTVYAFARRSGQSPEDARDLTQGFFARLIEKHWLADADREKGRFRTFLLTAFKRYRGHEVEHDHAQKRGGNHSFSSLDAETEESELIFEPADHRTPEIVYEERWATALLQRVLSRLREEFILQGRETLFDGLEGFLLGDPPTQGVTPIAARLGMTEGAARMIITRMRKRYRQLLRSEIAQTVVEPQDIEDELLHLYRVLNGDLP
jgi:RNA polymerase sigma factor (sigma-70 family)